MLVNSWLSTSQQHAVAVKRANCNLGCSRYNMTHQSKEVIILTYLELVWPQLEYCVQIMLKYLTASRGGQQS